MKKNGNQNAERTISNTYVYIRRCVYDDTHGYNPSRRQNAHKQYDFNYVIRWRNCANSPYMNYA